MFRIEPSAMRWKTRVALMLLFQLPALGQASASISLVMHLHGYTFGLLDITTPDQISQTFPLCICILQVIKDWRQDWPENKANTHSHTAPSNWLYLMGNNSGQNHLQGPVCTISHRHSLHAVIQVLLYCLDGMASLQSWTDLCQHFFFNAQWQPLD